MPAQVALLRGINLGSRNRIAMPSLRDALEAAGLGNIRTYVQSGNVVLQSSEAPDAVAELCRRVIAESFGLEIAVLVRTRNELAAVVERDPLGDVVNNPKRYQVTFLDRELDSAVIERLTAAALPPEQLIVSGREIYAWHPDGVGRSKLSARLAGRGLGVTATARNWTTVTTLLEMTGG